MSELVPIPLAMLAQRALLEYDREGKIFDLPKSKFFHGFPGLDLAVDFHGRRASTPLGPAAGPHGQLAQNIALSWLGGSRIIELKTVQILDELEIPRPCIDVANVGYNVEWSQELKLEQSLTEYVSAAMLIEILKAAHISGESTPTDTAFDMSVGYNLEGIRSPRVRSWIAMMKDASLVIDQLRVTLPHEWRGLPFPTCISDTVSLSTFHGCPADEIEGIVRFLLTEMDCHVCIKLNPTLLGREEIERLLHGVLGYREIQLHPEAFEQDLQFDQAIDLIPALQRVAQVHGKSLSVKFSNTLVVKNHKGVLPGDLMYLSGPPLHVLALNLAKKFRERVDVPASFSGGLDAHNIASTMALNLIPVTTCTDLLRPGGYGRLIRYLENLAAKMTEVGVSTIPEYIAHFAGKEAALVAEATANPRYSWERNHGTPRKIGSKLWIFDCINCDKCVPVCPNDANFVYETQDAAIEYDNFELLPGRIRRVPGGVLRIVKSHQLANYADACNACGNCDVFCPEEGGPFTAKPRFFRTLESYRRYGAPDGFYIEWPNTIHGTLAGRAYVLTLNEVTGMARFETPDAEVAVRIESGEAAAWKARRPDVEASYLDLLPYLKLKILLASIADPRHIHFANADLLKETPIANRPVPR